MMNAVERDHGVLHILFNHAGIPGEPGLDVEPDQWAKTVDVNQRSAFFATKYALPLLRAADRKGSIIFTSSVSGEVGSPFSPLYSMTKGAIHAFVRSLGTALLIDPSSAARAELEEVAWDIIDVPATNRFLMPVLTTVPLQLLAYHIAVYRGTDVDQPRNLAKSVTVE